MSGITASVIVASMTRLDVFMKRPMKRFANYTVGVNKFCFLPNTAVPVFLVSDPLPTFIGAALDNIRPKPFLKRRMASGLSRTGITTRDTPIISKKTAPDFFTAYGAISNLDLFHSILQAKVRCLTLFRFLSRESGSVRKTTDLCPEIKNPVNSLDGSIIPQRTVI